LYDEDEITMSDEDRDMFSDKIRKFYFGQEVISKENRRNLTNLYTDRYFIHGVKETILLHAKKSPVYPYIFTFQGDFSFLSFFGVNDIKGVTHGDDTQYFFNTSSTPELKPGSESEKFSEKIVKLWVSFAETGVPTATWEPKTEWRSFETSETRGSYPLKWYKLDYNTELMEEYFTSRLEFWDALLKQTSNRIDKSIPAKDEF
jgi:carboxylesterase type B